MYVFAYWDSDDRRLIADFEQDWLSSVPRSEIFGPADVTPIVEEFFPHHRETYDKIRVPAAKADVARLLLLYKRGGLYIDCHVGLRSLSHLNELFKTLSNIDFVFLDRMQSIKPRLPGEHFVTNSIILANSAQTLFLTIAERALENLERQRHTEQLEGFAPYRIGVLSGPTLVNSLILAPDSGNRQVAPSYADRLMIISEETAPVARYHYSGYRAARSPLERAPDVGTTV